MARKYLHPEKLFGIGLKPVDKLVNRLYLSKYTHDPSYMDDMLKRMSKRDHLFIKKMVERDGFKKVGEKYQFNDGVSYSMKVAQDILDRHTPTNLPIYSIGKDFFKIVKSLQRDIPVKNILLDEKFLYLKFKGEKYEGAYVTSYDLGEDMEGTYTGIRISFTPKHYDITGMKTLVFMICGDKFDVSTTNIIKKQEDMRDFSSSFVIDSYDNFYDDMDLIMGVINSVIYIKSKDPIIESFKPLRKYTKKELNKIESNKREELCYFPLKLLNWSYHGRHYSTNETNVMPHLRWQPCGVGRNDVKLIWVKEHVRHYHNQGE